MWAPLCLALGLGLSGCSVVAAGPGATSDAASPPLHGTTWALVALTGAVSAPPQPLHVQAAQLRFEADPPRVSGSTGCNQLTGRYTLNGAQLSFSAPATSRRACMDEAGTTEQRFLAGLEQVRGWHIEGRLLLLTDAGGTPVLRLHATP